MAEEVPTDPAPPAPAPGSAPIDVLVIDDDPLSVELLSYTLPDRMRECMKFHVAHSLSQAFMMLETGTPADVVLLDLGIPGAGGRSTLQAFRSQRPGLPVVILTSNDDDQLRDQLIEDGAFSYLVKGQMSAQEVANILIRVAQIQRGVYRVAPNEEEIVRKSTDAQSRLRRVLTLAPQSVSRSTLAVAQAEVVAANAAENSLMLSKLDRALIELSELRATQSHHDSRIKRHSERIETLDRDQLERLDRIRSDLDDLRDDFSDQRVSHAEVIADVRLEQAKAAAKEPHQLTLSRIRWGTIAKIVVPIALAIISGAFGVARSCSASDDVAGSSTR